MPAVSLYRSLFLHPARALLAWTVSMALKLFLRHALLSWCSCFCICWFCWCCCCSVVVAPAMRLLKMLHLLSARRFVGNAFPFWFDLNAAPRCVWLETTCNLPSHLLPSPPAVDNSETPVACSRHIRSNWSAQLQPQLSPSRKRLSIVASFCGFQLCVFLYQCHRDSLEKTLSHKVKVNK